jgi:hypothetical protein
MGPLRQPDTASRPTAFLSAAAGQERAHHRAGYRQQPQALAQDDEQPVTISRAGREHLEAAEAADHAASDTDNIDDPETETETDETQDSDDARHADPTRPRRPGSDEPLSDAEIQQVRELQARDAEVRAHEQAHLAAGGGLVIGGASYTYQQGPDGRRYAIGGEVGIQIPSGGDPATRVRPLEQVQRAALAPAEPSGTDRAVATTAALAENQSRNELAAQQAQQNSDPRLRAYGAASDPVAASLGFSAQA